MRAVIKLGGALFKRNLDPAAIRKMAKTLAKLLPNDDKLVLVAGGGENAREYITAARKLGADESTSDLLGIKITRANAELLRVALESEGVSAAVASRLDAVPKLLRACQAAILGGLQPGQSTNMVAALAAEIVRANILVNATDVEGVYTDDPKRNPRASLLKAVSANQLLKMALAGEVAAGEYELFDPLAVKTLQRSRTPTRIVSIMQPDNIVRAVKGEDVGTLVTYD